MVVCQLFPEGHMRAVPTAQLNSVLHIAPSGTVLQTLADAVCFLQLCCAVTQWLLGSY